VLRRACADGHGLALVAGRVHDLRMTVAVVTGASRGIGRATATALAAEGFDVLVTGRSHDALKEVAAAPNMHAVAGDVRDPIHARHVMEVAVDLGRVDLLVNNAGMDGGPPFGLWERDPESWWSVIATNLRGPALMTAQVIPLMIAGGGGRVINMNSLVAGIAPPGYSHYSVSKAALQRLTECLALELAGTGISIFDLSPGLVRTAMTSGAGIFDDVPAERWTPLADVTRQLLALVSGHYDRLTGRFIDVTDNLDHLLESASEDHSARRLRLMPAGADDQLLS
jgi:3-oxoacyl-[acyl-carrier protein] reductase